MNYSFYEHYELLFFSFCYKNKTKQKKLKKTDRHFLAGKDTTETNYLGRLILNLYTTLKYLYNMIPYTLL